VSSASSGRAWRHWTIDSGLALAEVVRFHSRMNTKLIFSVAAAASLALSSGAWAGGAKDYQVTGPILEINENVITVQKGKDRWEINRDSNTKMSGDVKVGDKVTIHYVMTAKDVEMKEGKKQ
jgi:hypothetical protein